MKSTKKKPKSKWHFLRENQEQSLAFLSLTTFYISLITHMVMQLIKVFNPLIMNHNRSLMRYKVIKVWHINFDIILLIESLVIWNFTSFWIVSVFSTLNNFVSKKYWPQILPFNLRQKEVQFHFWAIFGKVDETGHHFIPKSF